MITNKERLEKIIEQIKRLERLTEEVRERDMYPVAFFSQAFDISNKIQDGLQEIEIFQIELIEAHVKEQQAQILSEVSQSTSTLFPEKMIPVSSELPEQQNHLFFQQEMVAPVNAPSAVQQVQKEKKVIPAYSSGRKNGIDLKKVITLNDRFLFCRELFANNENLMNQIFGELNMKESYDAAIDYLQERFEWNFDDENVVDFLAILKKRFT
ncbi:MAG: hypothetical protein FWG45_07510 [Oscillospiraceae bacterium]|nr:hypothetical protein [Oscillospiraceae bacterium]